MKTEYSKQELAWRDEHGKPVDNRITDGYSRSDYFKEPIPEVFDLKWFRENYLGPDCYGVGLKLVE